MDLIIYTRVSTHAQTDGFGLQVQEKACLRWARDHGHRIVGVLSDEGVSGSKDASERPGLAAAIDMVTPPPKATGILIARLDRLGRKLTVQEAILQMVWRAGASVFTADGGEVLQDDPDDPMRAAMRQMAGVFAELERAQITKRMRDGRNAKRADGKHSVGDYAFGRHGEGKGRDRDAAPNPLEMPTVARIVELRRAGRSYRQIASTLDTEGLKPRRAATWSSVAVRNVCVRELVDVPTDAH